MKKNAKKSQCKNSEADSKGTRKPNNKRKEI